ncbi:LpxI family protein [Yoonia sp. R2331]|uniref:LpxI family protein n=1 Tax=Yoonia sp. R2331 TaxID=3237238 RepID=UPI0034E4A7ED
MLALIAGTGDLPQALLERLKTPPLVCALYGNTPKVRADVTFRIEHLGELLDGLQARGVTEVCMAGAIQRPEIDASAISEATFPFVERILRALQSGDDGALRAVIGIFEDAGLTVKAAHEIAPDLLPTEGVLTEVMPEDWHAADATAGETAVAQMGARDVGQACVVRVGQVRATEGQDGTAAMLKRFHESFKEDSNDHGPIIAVADAVGEVLGDVADWLSGIDGPAPVTADDGILFKAPKPDQDRRADLPVIGPDTAMQAAEAALAGIVIEAGGVMVLDLPGVLQILNAQKMFLWVRPKGGG